MTFARYELMGALLRDARNTWSQVESLPLGPVYFIFLFYGLG